jgi:hypothetical protein
MKYLTILLILFTGTLLIDEPIQIAAMGRGTGSETIGIETTGSPITSTGHLRLINQ